MTAMPITTHIILASSARLETSHPASSSLQKSAQQNGSSTSHTVMISSPDINSQAQNKNISVNGQKSNIQNFFSSYTEILLQQQKMRVMIEQDLSGSGSVTTGTTSALNRYQTLQYRQNSSDRIFNLKGDIFQSMFKTTV